MLGTFRAIALAPFGAWMRWGLTKIPSIKALWPEMNPQTFAANQIAVFVFVMLKVLAPNYVWTAAIQSGVLGSLSTVSTFFAELHTLYYEKGPFISQRYLLATVFTSIIIIQIVEAISDAAT